jgi:thiol-disulfide isomerase/thioredoxin
LVVELSTDDFDKVVGMDKYVVVKFYTRWCTYCRIMAPEYDKLFDIYKEKRTDLVIARLEGSINEQISMRYGIFSFPLVALFVPGDKHVKAVFQGQRVAQTIGAWIDNNAPELEKTVEEKKEVISNVYNDNDKNKNSTSILENIPIIEIKVNQTEVTDEIDFIKREVITLRKKLEKIEIEIEEFKKLNSTRGLNILSEEVIRIPFNLRLPTMFEIFAISGVILILIALIFTIKKLSKGRLTITPNLHAKV